MSDNWLGSADHSVSQIVPATRDEVEQALLQDQDGLDWFGPLKRIADGVFEFHKEHDRWTALGRVTLETTEVGGKDATLVTINSAPGTYSTGIWLNKIVRQFGGRGEPDGPRIEIC